MTVKRIILQTAGFGVMAAVLGACNLTSGGAAVDPTDGVGFRQARYAEVMRVNSFQSCREEALLMDRQARKRGAAGAYLTSATIMEKCEAGLGGSPRGVSHDDRMRLAALAIINFLKGGDSEKARQSLSKFQRTYPGEDIYFGDGSSFIATAELLLGRSRKMGFGEFAVLNVNRTVKNEMRRLAHWKDK
ncbi:MAG: hypothetical protein JKY20_11275 [Alphaproteobacteria bacterium]|nr:hypothetical protein [Alphaproteobacteria bacterium]